MRLKRSISTLLPVIGILLLSSAFLATGQAAPPQSTPTLQPHILARRDAVTTIDNFLRSADPKGNITRSHYYERFTQPSYGYWIWTGIGFYIRMGLRSGQKHIPLENFADRDVGGMTMHLPDGMSVLKYYIVKNGIVTSLPSGLDFNTIPLPVSCAIMGGIRGTFYVSDVVDTIVPLPNNSFASIDTVVGSLYAGVTAAMSTMSSQGVDQVIGAVPTIIDLSPVANKFGPGIVTISGELNTTAGMVTLLQGNATIVDQAVGDITTALNAVLSALTTISTQISNLNAAQSYNDGTSDTYTLTNPIPDPSSASTDINNAKTQVANNAPNAVNQVNSNMGSINIAQLGATAYQVGTTIAGDVQDQFDTAIDQARATAKDNLNNLEANIMTTVSDLGIEGKLADVRDQYLSTANEYLPYATKYYPYARYGLWVFFALPAIPLIVIFFGISGRSPRCVKCCLIGTIPMILFFVLWSILLIIITVLLGDAIDRTSTPPPLDIIAAQYLDANMTALIPTVFSVIDDCGGGDSLIEVGLRYADTFQAQFGFNVSDMNITSLAGSYIDDFSFGGVSSQINTNSYTSQFSPTSAQTAINNAKSAIQSYSTTPITNLKASNIQPAINDINNIITYLQHTFTASEFTYNTASAASKGTTAANNFNAAVNAAGGALANLQALVAATGSLGGLSGKIDVLVTKVGDLKICVGDLATQATTVTNDVNTLLGQITTFVNQIDTNITAGMPTIRSILYTAVDAAQTSLYARTSCAPVALAIYDIETIACHGVPTGLDTFWLACFWIVSFGTMAVPTFTGAANILADKDAGNAATLSRKRGKKEKKAKKGKEGRSGDAVNKAEAGEHQWKSGGGGGAGGAGEKGKSSGDVRREVEIQKTSIMPAESPTVPHETMSPASPIPDYDETADEASSPTHLLANPPRFDSVVPDQSVEELRPAWLRPSQGQARPSQAQSRPSQGQATPASLKAKEAGFDTASAPPFMDAYNPSYQDSQHQHQPSYDPYAGGPAYGNEWDQAVPAGAYDDDGGQVYPAVPEMPEHLVGYMSPPGFEQEYHEDDERYGGGGQHQ
ncbi:hypothetical protein HDV00_004461 [Rhizophlyctis rosea]|nr:hypothetical protein HDV00_004461 [Rhizophlyctis rosea]